MEIQLVKMDIDGKVDLAKADELDKKFDLYALKRDVIEIQEDV